MSVPTATPSEPTPGHPGPVRARTSGSAVVVIGVIAVAFAVAACVMPKTSPRSGGSPATPVVDVAKAEPVVQTASHIVVYQLLGQNARNLTYVAGGADLEQLAAVTVPWSVTITHTGPAGEAAFSSLAAQNAGPGTLTCRILVDGGLVAEKSVSGPGRQLSCTA
ncbi:MmpS family transport accessory protein [Amycolatopsis sp. PS_44_ISF1]|uniref:MmpS family transport accessory protein n=1 Tax=Amycolatopsis sp. PS_44_ISF1 TaxID=2974917 RepID=UPI0028DFB937|nr:MmpS family transport accessory protein [Amycolatopsis sp. PS_44_ISF1]MDT8915055.1 MmpS family protein [Amycolatopsis sp. PS_44_ISF1]